MRLARLKYCCKQEGRGEGYIGSHKVHPHDTAAPKPLFNKKAKYIQFQKKK
jgi:hypothetical protein